MAVSARVAPSASAEPPEGLEPGSPFGPNLRAFVIYLRSVQAFPLARLSHVLRDLFGLDISEGALVNILDASREPFAMQTSLIKARLLRAPRWLGRNRDEGRKGNWWALVFHHADSAVFIAAKETPAPGGCACVPRRLAPGLLDFGPLWRPDGLGNARAFRSASRISSRRQYAIDSGDAVFAPG